MVKVVYKTSDGTGYEDKLEACRNEFKWLQNRRDLLLKSLVRTKQEKLPRFTKKYLLAREEARMRMEGIRKNEKPEKKWLVRMAYYEALSKKFEALNDLQIEIRAYKKIRAEYKEKAEECKKAFEMYKAVEEGREIKASMGM